MRRNIGVDQHVHAGLHIDVAVLRDQVASLNNELLKANARLRE
jgi:hypothetical protein